MEKITKFQYLHNMLKQEIFTEKLRYGDRMPSINQLCDMYHVGVRTVKDVIAALREEGYIRTEERKNAVIVYKKDRPNEQILPVRFLFERRDAVLEVLRVMRQLYPSMFAQAVPLCTTADVMALRKILRGMDDLPLRRKLAVASSLFQRLLGRYGNPILLDLFIDLEFFTNLAVLDGFANPYDVLTTDAEQKIGGYIDMVSRGDVPGLQRVLEILYDNIYQFTLQYYDALARAYPQFVTHPQIGFAWYTQWAYPYAYLELARTVIDGIGTGLYRDGDFLPPVSAMSRDYSVSPQTVQKAIGVLVGLGLVRTFNGVGTRVTLGNLRNMDIRLEDSLMKKDAFAYLGALHVIVLSCRKIALIAFDHFTPDAVRTIEREVETIQNGFLLLDAFWRGIVDVQPFTALSEIFAQVNGLMKWGQCFVLARPIFIQGVVLCGRCKTALENIRTNDKDAFADTIESAFCYAFSALQKNLVSFGLTEAGTLAIPGVGVPILTSQ